MQSCGRVRESLAVFQEVEVERGSVKSAVKGPKLSKFRKLDARHMSSHCPNNC